MTKELQDLVWSVLPKEFREEVKRLFKSEYVSDRSYQYTTKMELLVNLFGLHNLTSDAEGEDEMLTVSRKRVQEMYAHYDAICYDPQRPKDYIESVYEHADGVTMALDDLFGSKCLPDNVATSEPNVDSSVGNVESLEPKPVEPKFKVGDYVRYKGDVHKVVATTKDNRCYLNKMLGSIDESDLEPYTEPEKNIAETRNLSQDRDKLFINILKNSFSKERRLAIAAQMMQGLICAPLVPGVDPNPSAEYLAQAAFRLADALIAEAKKGGSK